MHAALISSDLQTFRHSFTDRVVDNAASLFTFFPALGTYYLYALYKPAGANLQTFRATIRTTGALGRGPDLREDPSPVKSQGWLTFELLKEPGPIKRRA